MNVELLKQKEFAKKKIYTNELLNKRNDIFNQIYIIYLKLKLKPESLFLSLKLFDKYDDIINVENNHSNIKFISLFFLYLASKIEENDLILLKDFLKYFKKTTHLNDKNIKKIILKNEKRILEVFDYNLWLPTIFHFYLLSNKKITPKNIKKLFILCLKNPNELDSNLIEYF